MNEFSNTDDPVVDGFSDADADTETGADSPDPGRNPNAPKPLSPEEYAKAQKEAREPNEE